MNSKYTLIDPDGGHITLELPDDGDEQLADERFEYLEETDEEVSE